MNFVRFFVLSLGLSFLLGSAASVATYWWGNETLWFSFSSALALLTTLLIPNANALKQILIGYAFGMSFLLVVALPYWGVPLTTFLGLLGVVAVFYGKGKGKVQNPSFTIRGEAFLVGCLNFLFAILLASNLHQLFGNFIYHFVFSLMTFFLFQGIGLWLSRWGEKSAELLLPLFLFLTAVLGAASLFAIREAASHHNLLATLISHAVYLAILGGLAGVELGLILSNTKEQEKDLRSSFLMGGVAAAFINLVGAIFLEPTQSVLILSTILLSTLVYWSAKQQKQGPAKVGILLILCGMIFRFIWLIPSDHSTGFEKSYFGVTENSTVALSQNTGRQNLVAILTPAEDVEPDIESSPQFDHTVKRMSGFNKRVEWLSFYRDSALQYFSPLATQTDFIHHALVHPAMNLAKGHQNILILGGGDGLTAKEVIKYRDIHQVTVVEDDGGLARVVRTNPTLRIHTSDSLNHEKVLLIPADPIRWPERQTGKYDVIFIDSFDEKQFPFSRHFTNEFLVSLKRLLQKEGTIALSAPNYDSPGFWNVVRTAIAAGYEVIPHHSLDPSGLDGLILLSLQKIDLQSYGENFPQFPFIISELLLGREVLIQYADPTVIAAKTDSYPIHSIYHPTFFRYFPGSLSWEVSNTSN